MADSLNTLGSDGNTLTITVDGETDGDYEMWGQATLAANALNVLSIRPNGLTTNQTGETVTAANTSLSCAVVTAWDIANGQQAGATTVVTFHALLTSKSGRIRSCKFSARYNPTGSSSRLATGQLEWTATATALTSIVLNADNGLVAASNGTFIRLRKLGNTT
jgi:hypothetical protein